MRFLVLALVLSALVIPAFAATPLVPVINNAGFEEVAEGNAAPGWGWHCGAQAGFSSDTNDPHSGKRCLVFFNNTELIPGVYGRLSQGVNVIPGTEYELSMWVRGEDVQPGLHVTDWNSFRLDITVATYGWQKISTTFTTKPDQGRLDLGINIVNKCKALAVDDIYIRPVGNPLKANGIDGSYLVPGRVDGDNSSANVVIFATSTLDANATVEGTIKAGDEALFQKTSEIKPGENEIIWEWKSGKTLQRHLKLSLRVLDAQGNVLITAEKNIEKLSSTILLNDIAKIEEGMKEFDELYSRCRAEGIPMDYPDVCKTMFKQFIPLAKGDVKSGDMQRANNAVIDFNRSLENSLAWMNYYLKNPTLAPVAKRYQTSKVDIEGTSFIADRKDSKGRTDRGPILFSGYGHFSQVRKDMPKWPSYGVNIIQCAEFGPSAVLPKEDEVDLTQVNRLIKTLDNAAKQNVKVDFLISPHYFPDWPMKKWPHLGSAGGGFLGFCVDAPEAKQVIEKFLRIVVPLVKDKPALHSICLSNEPIYDRGASAYNTRPMWNEYLTKVHGDIKTLNERYKTSYKSFDEVPVGGGFDAPQFYDYCIFNKIRFGNWHKWMADVIHEMAPDVPVHAKLCLVLELPSRNYSTWGVDLEYIGNATDLNGNDCYFQAGPAGEWASNWQTQNVMYDLQRSMADKPIFNSENHPTQDGSGRYVKPEHFRTCLWQGAIHGQGATTFWVWERSIPGAEWSYPFYGNVMDRPGCAEAVGMTNLDMNRFADEVTALKNVKAPVAIVYSKASFMRNGAYIDAMNRVYTALNFCGVRVDFISEDQLAADKGRSYKMIVLPQTTHMPEAAFKALVNLPQAVRLVVFGENPQKDQWMRDFAVADVDLVKNRSLIIDGKSDSKTMWPVIHKELARIKALPGLSVVDAKTGQPVWGVEWLVTDHNGKTLINIVNLLNEPVDVKVVYGGRTAAAKDLLSFGGQQPVRTLKPITPVLAEVSK